MRDRSVFCSAIIPTVGRPTLARAVGSVLDQVPAEGVEVIVVNDSGRPLAREPWQASARVRIIETPQVERSAARNAGAGVARGEYLHFLDDDDLILPGAVDAWLALRRRHPGVGWFYGGYRTVNNAGATVMEFRPELQGDVVAALVSGENIPLQASLLHAGAFAAIGGFDPVFHSAEDHDIGCRLSLETRVAVTRSLVAVIRVGEVGSTTDWAALTDMDRRGREKILGRSGALGRLRRSAGTPYWRGRVVRACAASAAWNVRHQSPMVATTRLAAAASLGASRCVLSPAFWRGVRRVR